MRWMKVVKEVRGVEGVEVIVAWNSDYDSASHEDLTV